MRQTRQKERKILVGFASVKICLLFG